MLKQALPLIAGIALAGSSVITAAAHQSLGAEAQGCGKPPVVAQRNAAAAELRAAFHTDHRLLVSLHKGGGDVDHAARNATIHDADAQLRDTYFAALDGLGALTLGRAGHEVADSSDAQAAPENEDVNETEDVNEVADENEAEDQAEACPDRTPADQAAIDALVVKAKDDMAKIAADAVAALGSPDATPRGKSAEKSGSSDHGRSGDHGKPASPGKSGEHGKRDK